MPSSAAPCAACKAAAAPPPGAGTRAASRARKSPIVSSLMGTRPPPLRRPAGGLPLRVSRRGGPAAKLARRGYGLPRRPTGGFGVKEPLLLLTLTGAPRPAADPGLLHQHPAAMRSVEMGGAWRIAGPGC